MCVFPPVVLVAAGNNSSSGEPFSTVHSSLSTVSAWHVDDVVGGDTTTLEGFFSGNNFSLNPGRLRPTLIISLKTACLCSALGCFQAIPANLVPAMDAVREMQPAKLTECFVDRDGVCG